VVVPPHEGANRIAPFQQLQVVCRPVFPAALVTSIAGLHAVFIPFTIMLITPELPIDGD